MWKRSSQSDQKSRLPVLEVTLPNILNSFYANSNSTNETEQIIGWSKRSYFIVPSVWICSQVKQNSMAALFCGLTRVNDGEAWLLSQVILHLTQLESRQYLHTHSQNELLQMQVTPTATYRTQEKQ